MSLIIGGAVGMTYMGGCIGTLGIGIGIGTDIGIGIGMMIERGNGIGDEAALARERGIGWRERSGGVFQRTHPVSRAAS